MLSEPPCFSLMYMVNTIPNQNWVSSWLPVGVDYDYRVLV